MGGASVFKRFEKKYLLSKEQYGELMNATAARLKSDDYGEYTIYNIYFDTPDFRLIRASIEKPVYKEKLRLRSYAVPTATSEVFVELKKKYKGVVYKRRVPMSYREAYYYLMKDVHPFEDNQILKEIDWFKSFYHPQPAVTLSYRREAFKGLEDPTLRMTFDTDILWRRNSLDLKNGAYGSPILGEGVRLMELKTSDAIPLWLCHILNGIEAFPTSFSKYGTCYTNMISENRTQKGVFYCA